MEKFNFKDKTLCSDYKNGKLNNVDIWKIIITLNDQEWFYKNTN